MGRRDSRAEFPAAGTGRGQDMKMVMAIIKPFKLDEVRESLTALGL